MNLYKVPGSETAPKGWGPRAFSLRGRSGNCKLMQNEKGDPRRALDAAKELDGYGEKVKMEF